MKSNGILINRFDRKFARRKWKTALGKNFHLRKKHFDTQVKDAEKLLFIPSFRVWIEMTNEKSA